MVIVFLILLSCFLILNLIALYEKKDSIYEHQPEEKNPLEGQTIIFVEDKDDDENANNIRGHLEGTALSEYVPGFYEKYIKRGLDLLFSFVALLLLSPLFLGIAIAIKTNDEGPVIFSQKRVGRRKQYFKIHKFRSMKSSSPQYMASAQMEDPDSYLTSVGSFLRRYSLDELPQLWDIFLGNMSFVGPRPVIWQEESLIALRDPYHANDVRPGLTGWAQINGRDTLCIEKKAELDGEYVKNIGFGMDFRCFVRSFTAFRAE